MRLLEEKANSADRDQTASQKLTDQDLHCLLRPIRSNIYNFYGLAIKLISSAF